MNKTISVSKTDAHFSGQIIDTNIMVKVRKGIDKKFPDTSEEDKSYIFNLIMSRPVYNGFKWDQTSGDLKLLFHGDENDKIYPELGISESEYLKVTYNIGLQPSLGNDDYKADLDADNIVNLYNNSSEDYLTVVNTYYNDIESGALNRADVIGTLNYRVGLKK